MEKSKKLVLFMPSMEGGGVEKNLITIANYFIKKYPKISLITYDNKFNHLFDKKIEIINVENKKKKNIKKYYKYFTCLILLIQEYLKNKKILVFSFQANIYSIILSIFFNFKVITRSNSSPVGWEGNQLKKYIFKFFFRYAENIIVNSHQFKKEFKKKFNINTVLIYNPLNKSQILKKSKETLNLKFFDDFESLKIINIARLTDQKDHLTLLKSFEIIIKKKKCKLLIMGYGNKKDDIKKFIKKNKLSDKIKIISFQKNPYNFLKKADIFVLTSKFEGLPNVLLEAQTLKKFVISSNCPTGPREILNNGKYGDLFHVGDYKKLAEQIIKYNKTSKIYKSKIKLAYNNLERFDYSRNCEKYFNIIYKNL
tara:strand:- start:1335 stop:2438 length:1104 start_codon:yes stop_codon:yes gene_type:complete